MSFAEYMPFISLFISLDSLNILLHRSLSAVGSVGTVGMRTVDDNCGTFTAKSACVPLITGECGCTKACGVRGENQKQWSASAFCGTGMRVWVKMLSVQVRHDRKTDRPINIKLKPTPKKMSPLFSPT